MGFLVNGTLKTLKELGDTGIYRQKFHRIRTRIYSMEQIKHFFLSQCFLGAVYMRAGIG